MAPLNATTSFAEINADEIDHSDEIWYPVPGFLGYEFSSDLRVRSWRIRGGRRKTPKLLTVSPNSNGYPSVVLRRDGVGHSRPVHRIVTEYIYGLLPKGLEVAHYDDNKNNNLASNLTYADRSVNQLDAARNGKRPLGSRHCNSKLTAEMVAEIVEMRKRGVSYKDIGLWAGINRSSVSLVVFGKTWKHANVDRTGIPGVHQKGNLLMADQVREIRKLRAEGVQRKVILSQFGISKSTYWSIISRQNWKHVD